MKCITFDVLIRSAYSIYANGTTANFRGRRTKIRGGPSWLRSEPYDIAAEVAGHVRGAEMNGPLLQTLLEDRLRLKSHRTNTVVPVYSLTVAKSGLRAQHSKEGECIQPDAANSTPQPTVLPKPCGVEGMKPGPMGLVYDIYGVSMGSLANLLTVRMDRDVIDETGLTGEFDIHLTFAPDETTPLFPHAGPVGSTNATGSPGDYTVGAASIPEGMSIFAAVEKQLGLKLIATKGTSEMIVIDHIEKPRESEN